jgi:hypothetical protein
LTAIDGARAVAFCAQPHARAALAVRFAAGRRRAVTRHWSKPMSKRPYRLLAVLAAAIVAGCATPPTTVDAQWVNPDLAGRKPVRSVVVLAAVRDSTHRRLTEDRMVAALDAAGVKATPSYRLLPEDGPVGEARLRRAVTDAGVSHALVTRIVNVTTQVNVTPGMVMGPAWGPGWGWGSGWGPGWGGFAGYYNTMWATSIPPQVTTTQNVHADTRLFDASTAVVLWSAATTTATGSAGVAQLIEQFVELVVATMRKDGVI